MLLPSRKQATFDSIAKEEPMKSRILRALAAGLIAGALLAAGAAPLGAPGIRTAVSGK